MDITDMLCDAVTALRHHRFLDPLGAAIPDMQATLAKATPVNCQPIYDDLTDRGEGVDMYDECIVRPPWANVKNHSTGGCQRWHGGLRIGWWD